MTVGIRRKRRRVGTVGRICAVALVAGLVCLVPGGAAAAAPQPTAPDPVPSSSATTSSPACPDRTTPQPGHAPVLAHFYIWYNASSWNRAKIDYPAVGRYSSDQVSVMRTQVAQARAAGVDGFIVSWKSNDTLNSRLAELRDVAAAADFKLAITYQALDFNRNPLPLAQVRDDLVHLADTYADDPVFHVLGDRPVVAISGTWHYSVDELRSITAPVASRLTVLATEKNVDDYERISSAVEGDLYYWSSADPKSTPHYQDKLMRMANVVREHCGYWVAPVAPGFDARQVGGHNVVARRGGDTLQHSWQAALSTVPDMIGVISWNEWSENTYVEPSVKFGRRDLDVLRDLTGAPPAPGGELDSSAPSAPASPLQPALVATAVLGSMVLVTVLGVRRRRRPTEP
jgi:hypothetical protein